MSRKYAWCWIVITGAMLLIAALFLVLYNQHQDSISGRTSASVLMELKQEISGHATEPVQETTMRSGENLYEEYAVPTEPEEAVMEVDGALYIGILTIPALELELPVLSEWSYPNLRIAPCRYSGTVAGNDIILAAHNYRSHFGNINNLHTGDTILFTDARGTVFTYEIIYSEMIDGYDTSAMQNGAGNSWDLTLFTCTLSGQSRVTIRAERKEK